MQTTGENFMAKVLLYMVNCQACSEVDEYSGVFKCCFLHSNSYFRWRHRSLGRFGYRYEPYNDRVFRLTPINYIFFVYGIMNDVPHICLQTILKVFITLYISIGFIIIIMKDNNYITTKLQKIANIDEQLFKIHKLIHFLFKPDNVY